MGASHAANVTADTPKPIIFKKSLRECPGSCSTPRSTNSLSACFTNPGLFLSSSRSFHYVFLLLIQALMRYPFGYFLFFQSIMALAALQSSNILHLHGLFAVLFVEFQQLVVVGIPFGVHIVLAATVDAPSHGQ